MDCARPFLAKPAKRTLVTIPVDRLEAIKSPAPQHPTRQYRHYQTAIIWRKSERIYAMPFPSAGCQTCRTRRIKCDETQPVCNRCAKSGRVCQGARKAFSVVHAENQYASGKKKRPRGPRTIPKEEPIIVLDARAFVNFLDLHTEAVWRFVRNHLQGFSDGPSILKTASDEMLPKWNPGRLGDECNILQLSISCVALAVFSRVHKYPPAAVEASINFQKLIHLLQATLPALDESNIESCLLATLCMCLYEDAMYDPQKRPGIPFVQTVKFTHQDGALAILKFWKEHLSSKQRPSNIIKHTRRATVKWALMRSSAMPDFLAEGSFYGEDGLELEYDRIVMKLTRLREGAAVLFKRHSGAPYYSGEVATEAEGLLEDARQLDAALQDWATHFPSHWSKTPHILPDSQVWPKEAFFSSKVYHYRSLTHAAVWHRYYSIRMLTNNTRLNVLQLNEANSDRVFRERAECQSIINTMADELITAVPFSLGSFKLEYDLGSRDPNITPNQDANIKPHNCSVIIMPISVASGISHIDSEKKSWFRNRLAHIGRILGYGIFEVAATENWIEF